MNGCSYCTQEQIEKESIDDIVNNILKEHDSDQDGCITQEEYLVWTVDNPMPAEFLDLLFQVLLWMFFIESSYM